MFTRGYFPVTPPGNHHELFTCLPGGRGATTLGHLSWESWEAQVGTIKDVSSPWDDV